MKSRRLSGGRIEWYNDRYRLRLQPLSTATEALLIVYVLKPNGYYRNKQKVPVQYPLDIAELTTIADALLE